MSDEQNMSVRISAVYFPKEGEVEATWEDPESEDGAVRVIFPVTPEQGERIAKIVSPCVYTRADLAQQPTPDDEFDAERILNAADKHREGVTKNDWDRFWTEQEVCKALTNSVRNLCALGKQYKEEARKAAPFSEGRSATYWNINYERVLHDYNFAMGRIKKLHEDLAHERERAEKAERERDELQIKVNNLTGEYTGVDSAKEIIEAIRRDDHPFETQQEAYEDIIESLVDRVNLNPNLISELNQMLGVAVEEQERLERELCSIEDDLGAWEISREGFNELLGIAEGTYYHDVIDVVKNIMLERDELRAELDELYRIIDTDGTLHSEPCDLHKTICEFAQDGANALAKQSALVAKNIELREEVERLREYAARMLNIYAWGNIDGGDVQEEALKLGIIAEVPGGYDPEKHGPMDGEYEPGERFYMPVWKLDRAELERGKGEQE